MSDQHSPREVVVAALAVPLPCPACGRAEACRCIRPEGWSATEARADLVVAALIEHGHLPDPDPRAVTPEDLERAAQWLAKASRHPRYEETGWRKILQSEADVEMASAQAERWGASDKATLAEVRALLLAHVGPRPR